MREIRISIFTITCFLLALGVVMVYSSSALYAHERWNDSLLFLKKHLVYLIIGALLMFYVMSLHIASIQKSSKALFLLSIILLIIVLVPGVGREAQGARRWLRLGSYSVQPSEIAKFACLMYLADFIARKGHTLKDLFYGYAPPIFAMGIAALLILVEPDFGTAIAVFVSGMLVLFVAGGRFKHLIFTFLAGLPILYYLIFSAPYRKKRLLIFLNPWSDSRGTGFQLIQSFLAIGSGGLFGVGLGQSKQKLFYLPESHTDFIFSIIAEELGFIGAGGLLILFGLLIWQGMRAAFKTEDIFKKCLIFGIISIIAIEVIINIGVSTGSIPTKGLPLPFISYGGTSLIMHMAAMGLLLNAMKE